MVKKPQLHIPQDEAELTAEWFSNALGKSALSDGSTAKVTSVERTVIGVGVGFLGELHRCDLTWDNSDASPTSVIAKIPSKNLVNRSSGEGLMAYEREIITYRDLHGDLGVRMPEHYHSEMDADPAPWIDKPLLRLFDVLPVGGVNWVVKQFLKLSGKSRRRYLLIMEHIGDAASPTQIEGGSIADVLQALEVLAGFHAHNWMSDRPAEISPRIWPINRVPKVWQAGYLRCRDEFVAEYGTLLGDDVIARLDQVQKDLPELLGPLGDAPWTLLHGDYRLDNLLYREDGEIVVLDFQLLALGRPGWDVGYFITTALTPDHRDEEQTMLRHYHDALKAAGIHDYSYDQLIADVEATKLLLAHRFVGASDTLETQIEGHDSTFVEVVLERIIGWIR